MIFGISTTNVFLWLSFGGVVGLMIHLLDPHKLRGGIWSTIILAMTGSFLGGFIATVLFGISLRTVNSQGLLAAVTVAIILAVLSRFIFRKKHYIKTTMTRFIS